MSKPLVISSDRVAEHNPFTRLDYDNFSYSHIASGETVRILSGQQMIVSSEIRVDGFLFIDGQAYVTEIKQLDPVVELPADNFSYYEISSNKTVRIPNQQHMYVRDFVRVDGFLEVFGQFAVGNSFQELPPKRLPSIVQMFQSYVVEQDEEYQFRSFLKIDGEVKNKGLITVGA